MFTKITKIAVVATSMALNANAVQANMYDTTGESWSIFGDVNGSGWGVAPAGSHGGDGWSIFGPVNGSGWSIFGNVNGSGWGVGPAGPQGGNGWSIFGPVNGSGWSIFGPVNGSGWGVNQGPATAPRGIPVMIVPLGGMLAAQPMPAQRQQPAFVAIHCTFGESTLLLAKSVEDCEDAGGNVSDAVRDASAKAGDANSDSGN
ncbi:MAG TPA: hypothetical protein ENK28_11210 [Aliiroseovarius sp.]|nr:hypothetical protein [Aliiroseovarius sp.]